MLEAMIILKRRPNAKELTSDYCGNVGGTNRGVGRQKRRYAELSRPECADADICHCNWC
jgi:hypothetical protein